VADVGFPSGAVHRHRRADGGAGGGVGGMIAQRARPSPLASITSALPVSISCSTRFGSASPGAEVVALVAAAKHRRPEFSRADYPVAAAEEGRNNPQFGCQFW
jgi:hypothetical protein